MQNDLKIMPLDNGAHGFTEAAHCDTAVNMLAKKAELKTKKFDELIQENFRNDSLLMQMKVENMMKIVREQTKKEIHMLYDIAIFENKNFIDSLTDLPTDRIKIF